MYPADRLDQIHVAGNILISTRFQPQSGWTKDLALVSFILRIQEQSMSMNCIYSMMHYFCLSGWKGSRTQFIVYHWVSHWMSRLKGTCTYSKHFFLTGSSFWVSGEHQEEECVGEGCVDRHRWRGPHGPTFWAGEVTGVIMRRRTCDQSRWLWIQAS